MNSNEDNNLKDILEKLEEGIKGFFESDRYKTFLDFASKFHNYSINNLVWLQLQKPNVQRVAGFKTWNQLGRKVNKGEKALKVLAPIKHKKMIETEQLDKITGKKLKEKQLVEWISYRAVPVFDISQTNGRDIPTLIDELKGNVKNKFILMNSLKNISKAEIFFQDIKGGAKGYYSCCDNKIVINNGMSEIQTLKTMVHEVAHSRLHKDIKNKSIETKELEAESVAYIVLKHFDIDTSDYSFGYLASWSKDKELSDFKESLNIIQKESNEIISELEKQIENTISLEQVLEDDYTNKIEQLEKSQLENEVFKEPYIIIKMAEGDKFKKGEVLTFKEANLKFRVEEKNVRILKEEFKLKGEYYPYFKVRFDLHYAPNSKISMRYDIGDGFAKDLVDFCNKEISNYYKPVVSNINKIKDIDMESTKVSIKKKLQDIKSNRNIKGTTRREKNYEK